MCIFFPNLRHAALGLFVFGLLGWWQSLPALETGYVGMDDNFPFAPAAGQAESTAMDKSDPLIVAWATGYTALNYGANVDAMWQTPEKALGPAVGDSFDIVSLGRGGSITLTFTSPIKNGSGADFAIFENSFSDTFLELAWVEVSSDGVHFVRFPNFSFIAEGEATDPALIHGLAGKYRQGFGTPFDLEQLPLAYQAILAGTHYFSEQYVAAFLDNFSQLNLAQIQYVRLIDCVGDGSALDAEGAPIYDPYPTTGSAGFELEAVAVINQVELSGLSQSIDFTPIGNQILSDASVALQAHASSGLAVEFEVISGPGSINGAVLQFTGRGQVVVRATQAGDVSYAPADPVTRSCYIADALQHLYLEPIANQLTDASQVPLYVRSSSGLPVSLFVDAGPEDAIVDSETHLFSSGLMPGRVTVRATQAGGQLNGIIYAPAEPVLATFDIVAAEDAAAPQSFAQWQQENGVSGADSNDADADGASDFLEYVANTNPQDAADRPHYIFEALPGGHTFEIRLNGRAPVRAQLWESDDLSLSSNWSEVIPEVLSSETSAPGEVPSRLIRLRVPKQGIQKFWRFQFESN